MMRFRALFVLVAVLALAVGVTTATAGGGGKARAAAKECQNGGYVNWMRADSTTFANADECIAYAVTKGNHLLPAVSSTPPPPPTATLCTAGNENFSGAAESTQPATFSGGTIDGPYVGGAPLASELIYQPASIYVDDSPGFLNWTFFASGTHLLWTGYGAQAFSFRLTFTNAVASVTLDSESFNVQQQGTYTSTLTGYNASGGVVASNSNTHTLSIGSVTNNIKYFEISNNDPQRNGIVFTNVVWGCVA